MGGSQKWTCEPSRIILCVSINVKLYDDKTIIFVIYILSIWDKGVFPASLVKEFYFF